MKPDELNYHRQARWRITPEHAIESNDDLQTFLEDIKWCFITPQKNIAFPSLQGAIFGGAERKISAAKQAAFQIALKELWKSRAIRNSFVQIHALGRSPMIVSRDICRKIARIYLPPTISPKKLRRNGTINSFEMEILERLEESGLSKKQLRLALDLRRKKRTELDKALRNLKKRLLVVEACVDEDDYIVNHFTPRYLRITEKSFKNPQVLTTGEFLVELYMRTVIADTRSGIKSFFKGILSPQIIDGALYKLLLQSHLKVEPEIIINNKKAIISKCYTNGFQLNPKKFGK